MDCLAVRSDVPQEIVDKLNAMLDDVYADSKFTGFMDEMGYPLWDAKGDEVNMITGVLFLIVSVALHILIPSQIRTLETSAVTAATVPTLLIRGMILCSVILLVQGILSKEKTEYTISGAIFTKENLLRLKPVIYIAMLIAYALLLPHIGFIISSLLLSNGILLYFGTRKWWFYAIASANVIVAYFAFQAMSVTLP